MCVKRRCNIHIATKFAKNRRIHLFILNDWKVLDRAKWWKFFGIYRINGINAVYINKALEQRVEQRRGHNPRENKKWLLIMRWCSPCSTQHMKTHTYVLSLNEIKRKNTSHENQINSLRKGSDNMATRRCYTNMISTSFLHIYL